MILPHVTSGDLQAGNLQQIQQSREYLEVIPENPRLEESQIIDNQGSPSTGGI